MTVEPLVPDIAPRLASPPRDAGAFLGALDAAGKVFANAQRAEDAFVAGRGGLQEMAVARAHADVALALATAAASRAAQALAQVLGMPV